MMILDKGFTRITVEEQVVTEVSLYAAVADQHCRYFEATVDGRSIEGYEINMTRQGKTPDEAIKHLFEAMHNAEVTL